MLVGHYAWALWLAAPLGGISLVSVVVWWQTRPARPASTRASIAGHEAFLAALAVSPRHVVPSPAPGGREEPKT